MNDSLGKKIYQLRKKKGMTQEPLARALEVSIDELLDFQKSLLDEEINAIKKT